MSTDLDEELDPRRWLVLGTIAVAQLMVILDGSVLNIALPTVQRALGMSDADRQWVITAYAVAFGGLLLLGGRVADAVGRKRVFITGLIGFAVASALGGLAPDAPVLFAARALQGVFAALLVPASLSLLAVTFTRPRERAAAFGVYSAVAGGGVALGLILGGVLTEYASWRWCLLVNTPIALVGAVAAVVLVQESRTPGRTRYDVPGAVLVTAGLAALVLGCTQAARAEVGWWALTATGPILAGVVLLVAFVTVERRSPAPLLPLRIVLDRDRGASFLAALLTGAAVFGIFLFLGYYFQVNLGYTPLRAGLAFLPFTAGIIAASGVASTLLHRTGPRPLMVTGGLLGTVGLLLLTQLQQDSRWAVHVLPAELLVSAGVALVFVPASSLALTDVAEHDAGIASAVLSAAQQVGGALGTAVLNTVYAGAVSASLATGSLAGSPDALRATIRGYHLGFGIAAAFFAAALVLCAALVRSGRLRIAPGAAEGGVRAPV